jgi:hypothetical protein
MAFESGLDDEQVQRAMHLYPRNVSEEQMRTLCVVRRRTDRPRDRQYHVVGHSRSLPGSWGRASRLKSTWARRM